MKKDEFSQRASLAVGSGRSRPDPRNGWQGLQQAGLSQEQEAELPKLVGLSKRVTVFLSCARPGQARKWPGGFAARCTGIMTFVRASHCAERHRVIRFPA